MSDLTEDQAYAAMFAFLDKWWLMTKSDDIGNLLSNLSLLSDGEPADPAVKSDWEKAVARARGGSVDLFMRL